MLGDNMKISIIIPAYNCEKYICQTLDCIRMQTFPKKDMEVIVFLDGCTDSTPFEVVEYSKKHPDMNIKLLKVDEKQGPSNARNCALQCATGEYVHFFDADDVINQDFYRLLYEAAKKADSDIAVASFSHERFPNDSVIFTDSIVLSVPQDKLNATKVDKHGFSWRYLIKRNFLQKNHFLFPTDMKYCEDMLIMTKCIYYSNNIVLVPKALYVYKYRQNSLLTTHETKREQNTYYKQAKIQVRVFLSQFDLSPTRNYHKRTRYVLFGLIPLILTVDGDECNKSYYLLGIIPLFSRRTNYKQERLVI